MSQRDNRQTDKSKGQTFSAILEVGWLLREEEASETGRVRLGLGGSLDTSHDRGATLDKKPEEWQELIVEMTTSPQESNVVAADLTKFLATAPLISILVT